mgnify:CR=1 FL=1
MTAQGHYEESTPKESVNEEDPEIVEEVPFKGRCFQQTCW